MDGIALVEYLRHYCVDPIAACNFACVGIVFYRARYAGDPLKIARNSLART